MLVTPCEPTDGTVFTTGITDVGLGRADCDKLSATGCPTDDKQDTDTSKFLKLPSHN